MTGENGIGKTNILEAISMLAPGRGLRGAQLEEITRHDCDGWHVLVELAGPTGLARVSVDYQNTGIGRRLRLDGEPMQGFEQLAAMVPQLWLTPAMDRLFTDAARGRRKFLDRFAQTLDPAVARHIAHFEKAMRERNKLLQTPGIAVQQNSWLDGLEEAMALQGVAIGVARLGALDTLAQGLAQMPENAFPRAGVALEGTLEADLRARSSALDVEDGYRTRLASARGVDAAAGRTLEGPHRSDLVVTHQAKGQPAATCSTGEQKALLVGLVLAQARSAAARLTNVPVLLLDEVGAHLDKHRRGALADILADLGGQSWITGTELDNFASFDMPFMNMTHIDVAHPENCAPRYLA